MVGRALASGYIGTHRVKEFLRRLGSPLGPRPPPAASALDPLSANHTAQTHAWFRPVLREVTTLHIPGRAVQVDPIKSTLKAPGTKRSKPNYDEPPSKFAFKFNLRRYTRGRACRLASCWRRWWQGLTLVHISAQHKRFLWDRGCG